MEKEGEGGGEGKGGEKVHLKIYSSTSGTMGKKSYKISPTLFYVPK